MKFTNKGPEVLDSFLLTWAEEQNEKRLDSFLRREKKEEGRSCGFRFYGFFEMIRVFTCFLILSKWLIHFPPLLAKRKTTGGRKRRILYLIDFLNFLYYLFDQMYSGSSSDRSLVMKGSNSNRCCWWTNIVCTDYCTSGGGHSIKGKNKDLLLFTPSTYSSFSNSFIWNLG